MAGRRVLESSTLNSVRESFLSSEDTGFLRAALLSTPKCIFELLSEYPDVLSSDGFTASPLCHGVCHRLLTQPGPPVFAKAWRQDPDKLESAKKEFASMEEARIIKRFFCSSLRLKFFSKLNLQKGYNQVPMAEDDIKKTGIITPLGRFEFLWLPFGLKNAGQTFQPLMDQVLEGFPFCFENVDDILIFSPDLASDRDHLWEVFKLCHLHGLTIGLLKCKFAVSEVEFLGHNLNHPLVQLYQWQWMPQNLM